MMNKKRQVELLLQAYALGYIIFSKGERPIEMTAKGKLFLKNFIKMYGVPDGYDSNNRENQIRAILAAVSALQSLAQEIAKDVVNSIMNGEDK